MTADGARKRPDDGSLVRCERADRDVRLCASGPEPQRNRADGVPLPTEDTIPARIAVADAIDKAAMKLPAELHDPDHARGRSSLV